MSNPNRGEPVLRIPNDDPLARALIDAIHAGEVELVMTQITEQEGLASARLVDDKGGSGTLLHAATDWPGYFRNGPQIVSVLIEAGADPSAPVEGSWHAETPLHWAASSDDVEVARALIDGGANIEAMGASLGGGTPLDDAVGYGCWQVARLLVERGAHVDLGHAAGLGLMTRVQALVAADPPNPQELTDAFWIACHGGQRRTAEFLLDRGADLNGTPSWGDASTPLDAADSQDTARQGLVRWLQEGGATRSSERSEPPC